MKDEELDTIGVEELADVEVSSEIGEIQPPFNSSEWSDYVLRQFKEDEMYNGCPTCDGCRRVVETLIGPIYASEIVQFEGPSTSNNGTSTVGVRLSIQVLNTTHPLYQSTLTVEDIADVNSKNTDIPYSKYPSATALTRAEGRALRKALRLNKVVVAEEMSKAAEEVSSNDEWNPDSMIEDGQISIIDMMCRPERCNLDVMQFINCGTNKYSCVEMVPRSVASQMIQVLNGIQQGIRQKPKNIGEYILNWRKKDESNS